MILIRTPLRISIGGGGTDLPSYYREFGGFVISGAINKYVYISINRTMFPGYFLKYSEIEKAATIDEIRHPLLRETLRYHQMPPNMEIVSLADIPAGTGLGSSGSFMVALTHALYAFRRQRATAETLARDAIEVEMNRLKEPVGKQDHYIAAYGGLICQDYKPDESVTITQLAMMPDTTRELQESLMMFFVGYTRNASELLADQKKKSEARDTAMLDGLHFAKQLGVDIRKTLETGDIPRFGELMHEHWLRKRGRSTGISNDHIDQLYELARSKGGATGGKLVGAGGSGFLLFSTKDRSRLRKVMHEAGLEEMDFRFDFYGSLLLVRTVAFS